MAGWKSFLEGYTRYYRQTRIQLILSLSFTGVAILGLLGFGFALFFRFSQLSNQQMMEQGQTILNQVNLSLDNYLRDAMRVSDTLYYRVIKSTDLATDDFQEALQLLYESNKNALVSLAVFGADGSLVAGAPLPELKDSASPKNQDWFQSALEQSEVFHFSNPQVENLFYNSSYRYQWVISLSRKVDLVKLGRLEDGVLLLNLSFDGIGELFQEANSPSLGYSYLMNPQGELIYHPQLQKIYSGLAQENHLTALSYGDGSQEEYYQGQRRQVTVKTVGYTGWKLVNVMPLETVASHSLQLALFFLFTLLFSVFLLVYLNQYLSHKISVPIKALETMVQSLDYGQELPELTQNSPYEIQRLHHAISSMVSTSHHLMADIIAQEEDKRRIELEVLHSQINPHFLYNTLDSVIWMTENQRNQEASALVTSLGKLFRIALSRGQSIIPLKDEMEHASHYLAIQQVRYRNSFETQLILEDQVADCRCLKLIIQPILENAIYHGVAFGQDEGEIVVRAFQQGETLVITVQDNGCGMRQEAVEKLLSGGYQGETSRGSGIGFYNVHKRIQLSCGQDYGLSLESEPDEGTCVTITLPLDKI